MDYMSRANRFWDIYFDSICDTELAMESKILHNIYYVARISCSKMSESMLDV